MPETKEEIRRNIYKYISDNIGLCTHVHSDALKKLLLAHDEAETKKESKLGKRAVYTEQKIRTYLSKAKTMPQTPKIQGNREALSLCLKWLTEDDIKPETPSPA